MGGKDREAGRIIDRDSIYSEILIPVIGEDEGKIEIERGRGIVEDYPDCAREKLK